MVRKKNPKNVKRIHFHILVRKRKGIVYIRTSIDPTFTPTTTTTTTTTTIPTEKLQIPLTHKKEKPRQAEAHQNSTWKISKKNGNFKPGIKEDKVKFNGVKNERNKNHRFQVLLRYAEKAYICVKKFPSRLSEITFLFYTFSKTPETKKNRVIRGRRREPMRGPPLYYTLHIVDTYIYVFYCCTIPKTTIMYFFIYYI